MSCTLKSGPVCWASTRPSLRRVVSVRAEAAAAGAPAAGFKLPKKGDALPTDAASVKALIAKTHEIHGQGRMLCFSLSQGVGKRGTAGTSLAHTDNLDWTAAASGSIDSYNLYT